LFWPYTKNVIATEVIVISLTQSVKHITKVPRPDTGDPSSFPSGHTAQAFASTTIFCDAFAQDKPWLKVTMYTGAASVGVLRILNNRHWASDVIAGAGFGILSAKLSELITQPRYLKQNHICLNPL
jgi:membrane-associated phospholipid phosphatase